MSGNHLVDLRIYDICKNKLQLSEGDAAAVSLELQELVNAEREIVRREQSAAALNNWQEMEDFIAQRVELLRRDIHNMHVELSAELRLQPDLPRPHTELMQWMFTYFVFQMGGIIALILLLLNK